MTSYAQPKSDLKFDNSTYALNYSKFTTVKQQITKFTWTKNYLQMTKLEGNYHMFLDQKHQFVCYMVCKLYNIYCTDDDNNKNHMDMINTYTECSMA